LIIAAYTGTAYAKAANGYELTAIAAVIIAGFSMSGGKGNLINVLFAVMALRLINTILIFLNMAGYFENLYVGIILMLALIVSTKRKAQNTLSLSRIKNRKRGEV
jgi:ribose transport system permease protein